ncbi:hypothetical protein Taro_048094 [Colocasia esculenta]|uniref:Uncharacterized protein n=1 Tax=Colocasia esculenta TaxID=4460 RepID=A0A843X770_COLES|nr:hypothetical protein [Colocasia esculenta]
MREKNSAAPPLFSWQKRRARYSSTMMETIPKRGVSRVQRHPNGTRYQFPMLACKGTDEYQDRKQETALHA